MRARGNAAMFCGLQVLAMWQIAEACEIWLTLANTTVIKNNAKARKAVADRFPAVFQSGSFFAANLMDPRYNGKLLIASQTRRAVEFITKQIGMRYPKTKDQCVAGLMKFVADGPLLPFTPDTKPSHWWTMHMWKAGLLRPRLGQLRLYTP